MSPYWEVRVKVRNGIARSYVVSAVKGFTVLAVSAALVLGGIMTTPVQAVAATPVGKSQAAKYRWARAARHARAKARAHARAVADAKARAARHAGARVRLAAAAAPAPAKPVAAGRWYKAKVSWYGPGFYGHGMAGGGKLKTNSMVVAHKTLPFGTRIEFAYGGKTVIAVVRDRGPFVAGRLFDLGPGTAKAIGFDKVGVGRVQYRILH
jgi:rare lipoprotein A (peptidoglycan hydrolase)